MSEQVTDTKDQAPTQKVVFAPEQQERVNELIKEAMGRAGREHREAAERAAAELKATQERFATLEEEIKTLRTKGGEGKGKQNDDDFKAEVERIKATHTEELARLRNAFTAKEQEAKKAAETLLSVKKQVAIQAAASKINFVDIGVTTKLTEDSIQWDEGRGKFIIVVDGKERMNSAFEPMSLDEFYAEFAAKNPYLVRGDFKSGAGSTESTHSGVSANGKYKVEDIFGPKSKAALAAKLAKEDINEYRRLKEIARENKIIA